MRIRVLVKPKKTAHERDIRVGEPLTFGVPLPRGAVRDTEQWTFGSAEGPITPVQTRALDRWPDGSIRWMLVDVQADLELTAGVEFDLSTSSGPTAASKTAEVALSEGAGTLTVDTGAARFIIRAGGAFPFDPVIVTNGHSNEATTSGLTITDADGGSCGVHLEAVEVETRGPLRSSILVSGTVRRSTGQAFLDLSARLHFFAGLPTVRLQLCLTNPNRARHPVGFWDLGDVGSVLVKDVALILRLPESDERTIAHCSLEAESPRAQYEIPLELYQDSSGGENWKSSNHMNRDRRVPITFRGYRVRSGSNTTETGLRATPVMTAEQGSRTVAATMEHFWENFPKACEVDQGSLTLRLFPRQYADAHEIQAGEQKTHDCYLSFGPDRVTEDPLDWCRAPAIACVDPDWTLSTDAVPFLSALDADHAALVDAAIDGPARFELKREVIDEFGWRHFGDIYGDHEAVRHADSMPLVSHYNNQFDPIAGFAHQFLRTADPRWWRAMSELAAHVIDIDIYRTVLDKWAYNHGLFWHTYHYGNADTATHRTYPRSARGRIHGGGPSADHNYTTGLMLHYFITGQATSRQTVVDSAEYVINLDDGRKTIFRWLDRSDTGHAAQSLPGYYGPGRGPANSLNALIDGHRLSGDPRFLEKAEQLVRRVIHPQDNISQRRLDLPEQRWFYTMFLQSLGKYLQYKVERTQLDAAYAYGRASLLHYARWMAPNEYPYLEKPEKLEFPTETWAAQDIRKSDVFYFAALHSTGDERQRFAEKGHFFHKTAINTIQRMPTRSLARPVVILLSSGFMYSWFRDHPENRAPAVATDYQFRSPEVFVPQRARAKRRAVWLAACGAVLAVLVSLTLLWR